MKAIFLDIDGVLNTEKFCRKNYRKFKKTGLKEPDINEEYVQNLSRIVDETDSYVILSNTWKSYFKHLDGELVPEGFNIDAYKLYELFLKYDIPLADKTKEFELKNKEVEINTYLENNPQITNYLIINSEDLDLSYKNKRHTLVTNNNGLNEKDIDKAIEILNKKVKIIK